MHKVGPVARAYRAGAMNLTAATDTPIPLDTITAGDDPGGVVDTAHFFGGTSAQLVTNAGVYICPSDGVYEVTWCFAATTNAATGQRVWSILYHSGSADTNGSLVFEANSGIGIFSAGAAKVTCSAGDTLQLRGRSNAGLAILAGRAFCTMTVQLVG